MSAAFPALLIWKESDAVDTPKGHMTDGRARILSLTLILSPCSQPLHCATCSVDKELGGRVGWGMCG